MLEFTRTPSAVRTLLKLWLCVSRQVFWISCECQMFHLRTLHSDTERGGNLLVVKVIKNIQ